MSINVKLRYYDRKGRQVKDVPVVQTPTKVTFQILPYRRKIEDFYGPYQRYADYVREIWSDDQKAVSEHLSMIMEVQLTYGDDYQAVWESL